MNSLLLSSIINDQINLIKSYKIIDREYSFEPNANYVFGVNKEYQAAEEVLAERPDLAVSAADEALRDAVQAMLEVQDALAATRTAGGWRELSPSAAEAALGDLLPAHEDTVSLTVSENNLQHLSLQIV